MSDQAGLSAALVTVGVASLLVAVAVSLAKPTRRPATP